MKITLKAPIMKLVDKTKASIHQHQNIYFSKYTWASFEIKLKYNTDYIQSNGHYEMFVLPNKWSQTRNQWLKVRNSQGHYYKNGLSRYPAS